MFHIYVIINNINNKIYVGKTNNLRVRINSYKCTKNKGPSPRYIDRAIKKHGWVNFTIQSIESFESEVEVFEAEIFWIQYLQSSRFSNGYNIAVGGAGGTAGVSPSEENRKNMSERSRGELSYKAAFSNKMANEIRTKFSSGKYLISDLEKEYEFGYCTINNILKNRSYYDPNYKPNKDVMQEMKRLALSRPKRRSKIIDANGIIYDNTSKAGLAHGVSSHVVLYSVNKKLRESKWKDFFNWVD